MAGDPGVEAGARTHCPRCDQEVMQHSMIPVLCDHAADPVAAPQLAAPQVAYVCQACARTLVAVGAEPADTAAAADLAEV